MEPWHLIENDHANITSLCGNILRSTSGPGPGSRERLFEHLEDELDRHMEAEEDSLYEALEDDERTRGLVAELEDEHEEIERQLGALARVRDKGSPDWTSRFEDFTYLIDQHFHREEHELIPAARQVLEGSRLLKLRHEFSEEKIEELRESRGERQGVSSGMIAGGIAAAAVGAIAFAAWRRGWLHAMASPAAGRRFLSEYPGLRSIAGRFGRGRALGAQEPDVLKDIADRTSCPVQDVSSRLQMPIGKTYAVVASLERKGLVRSHRREGPLDRVVAITPRGREEVRHW